MKALLQYLKHLLKCKRVPKCWIASLWLKIGASFNEYELYAIKFSIQSELTFKLCDKQRAQLLQLIKFCDYRLGLLKKYKHWPKQLMASVTNNLPFLTSINNK